LTYLLFTCRP